MKDQDNSEECIVPAEELWAMKRRQQALDRERAASGKCPAQAMLLLRPDRIRGARIDWPDVSLLDDADNPGEGDKL